jgi:phytoene dehydrogenase-like protein/intracellular septation protein A
MFQVLFGFLPWIVFWVFSGMDNWPVAILGALFTAAAIVLWRRWKRHDFKTMEVVSLAFFAIHAIVSLALGNDFLIHYGPAVNGLVLAGMAWGSLLAKSPFTYEYAREDWPREYWDNPMFIRINQIITGVWGVIFLVNAGLGALSIAFPQYNMLLNVWLNFTFIALGIVFSSVFPNWYTKRAIQEEIDAREPYKWPAPTFDAPPTAPNEHDVIVIGSGIGGLTAGALLAHRRLKVAVFEQHFLPGGYCTSWERGVRQKDGTRWRYVFDAGVHDVSGLGENGPVHRTLTQLGIADQLDWRRMEHEYHVDGIDLRIPSNPDEFVTELGEMFPDEANAIREFFDEMHAIYRELYADVDEAGGVPGPPQTVEATLAYPKTHPHIYRWLNSSFQEMLDAYFDDARLKRFLSSLTGYLTDDPSQLSVGAMAPIFGYYFDGGFYPAGSTQKLADALVAVIEENGGKVHLRTPVERVLIEDGRAAGVVLAKSGETHRAKAIISNADLRRTFLDMVGKAHLPEDFAHQIEAIKPATSAFMVFLGVDFIPDVAPLTMTENAGIMIPSKVDPSLAPEGHSAITLITLIPQKEAANWDRKAKGYTKRKRAFGDELIARAEKVIPGLSQHIVYRQEASPRTFERYAWTTAGSIYGPTWDSFRPPLKSPIPGLYLAGAGVFPGPGIEAVVISGVLAADTIFKP